MKIVLSRPVVVLVLAFAAACGSLDPIGPQDATGGDDGGVDGGSTDGAAGAPPVDRAGFPDGIPYGGTSAYVAVTSPARDSLVYRMYPAPLTACPPAGSPTAPLVVGLIAWGAAATRTVAARGARTTDTEVSGGGGTKQCDGNRLRSDGSKLTGALGEGSGSFRRGSRRRARPPA